MTNKGETMQRLLSTKKAADYLGVSERTMVRMREDGTGPRYCRIAERLVRYDQRDLDAYIERGKEDKEGDDDSE